MNTLTKRIFSIKEVEEKEEAKSNGKARPELDYFDIITLCAEYYGIINDKNNQAAQTVLEGLKNLNTAVMIPGEFQLFLSQPRNPS